LFAHAPKNLSTAPALVVALHGCTQTAVDYDFGSGWSTLADRCAFVVIYPEQQRVNNPLNCFSWFVPGDTKREAGEVLSIRQMVEHTILKFGIDRQRIFVTGLSAGGAMASVMLATYPEVFAGGAIIAGLPYGCAASAEEAFQLMREAHPASGRALGDRVRAASNHRGPWPTLSVWHGSGDYVVNPANADNIVAQWMDVHDLSSAPTVELDVGVQRRVWRNAIGDRKIEAVAIAGMAHGLPLATGPDSCGAAGPFFLDVGISSTDHVAAFWGLQERPVLARRPFALVVPAAAAVLDVAGPELHGLRQRGSTSIEVMAAAFGPGQRATASPLDPNAVIAAAMEAAGLRATPAALGPKEPGPIIEAALKAAGLIKR
jgi:poly(hydroxyalkanoate) depolymerase family esterase